MDETENKVVDTVVENVADTTGQTEENNPENGQTEVEGAVADPVETEKPTEGTGEVEGEGNANDEGEPDIKELLKFKVVKDFIQGVRKEEKDKLYGQIKTKDDKISELEGTITTLNTTIAAYRDGAEGVNTDLQGQITELTKKLAKMDEDKQAANIALYREKAIRAIRDGGADLIEELVTGSTEEEIEQSIEVATAKYVEIATKVGGTRKPTEVPVTTAPPQGKGARRFTSEDIANMSPDEYKKYRADIKKQIGI